jgi:perosamine synthetase
MTDYNELIERIKKSHGKYRGNEIDYVLAALDTERPDFKKTSFVGKFEQAFAKRFGKRFAVTCNSATSGLHAALAAVGVGPGDEVISPAFNVIMSAYATIHLGGVPIFADVDPKTHNIDPADVARKITPRTKAIIAVAWNGLPVDIDPLSALAKQRKILLIEDVAQDVLGYTNGRISGTIGDIGIWSFNYKKHISGATEGGILCTDDEALAIKIRKFSGIGYRTLGAVSGGTSLAKPEFQNPDFERFDAIGLNYRMSEISAAVCLGQLERIDELVARRKECGRIFNEAIAGCDWMTPQFVPPGLEHSYYTVAMVYDGAARFGVPWRRFYNRYIELGGDGFYGELQCPYNEPSLRGKDFGRGVLSRGLCPAAESLQPRIMKFKGNYRDLDNARQKASILHRLIGEVSAGKLAA